MCGGSEERRGGSQILAPVRKEEENREVEILKLRLDFLKLEEIQLKMWILVQSGHHPFRILLKLKNLHQGPRLEFSPVLSDFPECVGGQGGPGG